MPDTPEQVDARDLRELVLAAERNATREVTADTEMMLVRVRSNARTYWVVSNGVATRSYAPHVAEREAVARFEDDVQLRHERVVVHRTHRTASDAAALITRTYRGS